MSIHLQRQFDRLKKHILQLGTLVEEQVEQAIRAVETRDIELADKVIAGDQAVDDGEVEIEEECLHTLALHQPVAFDLRYVVAVLKIDNDLERIGDLAVNIAEQAKFLATDIHIQDQPFDMIGMGRKVRHMLKRALDALVNVDPKLAEQVRQSDDEVDQIHREMYISVEAAIRENPHHLEQYINMLNISRQLERMGDHAVNIAEDVIYMARGDIARHGQAGARRRDVRTQP
jgi:phosphate transport system protein